MKHKLLMSLFLGTHASLLIPFMSEPALARPTKLYIRRPVQVQVIDRSRRPVVNPRVRGNDSNFNRRIKPGARFDNSIFNRRSNFDNGISNRGNNNDFDQPRRDVDADSGRGRRGLIRF